MPQTSPNKIHILFGVILVLISSLIMTASAIECYSCESAYEAGCGFNFDSEDYFKVDCKKKAPPRHIEKVMHVVNSTACMKIIYKEQSVTKYIRSCYFGDIGNVDKGCVMDPTMTDIHDFQCFVCDDDDYCNAATWSLTDRWSAIGSLLIFVLTAKLLNMPCL